MNGTMSHFKPGRSLWHLLKYPRVSLAIHLGSCLVYRLRSSGSTGHLWEAPRAPDLEPCEPQEAGRGLTTRPAKLLREQVQSAKSIPS